MFKIIFYQNRNGESPVIDFIEELQRKAGDNKDSRVNYHKVIAYLDMLSEMGTRIGEPVTKGREQYEP